MTLNLSLIERNKEIIYETNYENGSKFSSLPDVVVARSFYDNTSWVYFKTQDMSLVKSIINDILNK